MTHNTTHYSFPYPDETDAPDGATQMNNLATAIDTQMFTNAGLVGATKPPVYFSSSGTFASTAVGNAKYLRITCVNGGGGSGGNPACSSTAAVSGGGAGGATAVRTVAVSAVTFPITVTVGAAGSGGASGTGTGGTGGTSKCVDAAAVTQCSAGVQNANQGGSAQVAGTSNTSSGVIGFDGSTTGATADILLPGGPAITGQRISGTVAFAQKGGDSQYGHGGYGGAGANGQAGTGFGAGAGGAAFTSGSATAGQVATGGLVIIELLS